jgi:hypothetical protein
MFLKMSHTRKHKIGLEKKRKEKEDRNEKERKEREKKKYGSRRCVWDFS